MHRCYLCTLTTNHQEYLKRHLKRIHGSTNVNLDCKWCSFQANGLKEIEEHIKEAHYKLQEIHLCDQCNFSSFHHPTLEAHVVSIHKQWNCKFCHFVGSSKLSLTFHIKSKHNVEHGKSRMQRCYLCTFTTTAKQYLMVHINKVHGNIKVNLNCKWCSFKADGLTSIEELRRMVAWSKASVSHAGGREFETASGLHPRFDAS